MASLVADEIERLLAAKPDAVLGLATGSSPLAVYEELIRRHRAGRISFARARGFLLDEYVGLPAEHPEGYRNVIEREFAAHVDFADGAVQAPPGAVSSAELPDACAAYERAIAEAGGVTSSCSASAPTGTSPSTSPAPRSPRAPGSRP